MNSIDYITVIQGLIQRQYCDKNGELSLSCEYMKEENSKWTCTY